MEGVVDHTSDACVDERGRESDWTCWEESLGMLWDELAWEGRWRSVATRARGRGRNSRKNEFGAYFFTGELNPSAPIWVALMVS